MADALAAWGVQPAVREARLVTEWQRVVGARIATRAWPDSLKKGVLRVRVASAAWMHELGFLREALVGKLNDAVGGAPLVSEIRFWQGGRSTRSTDADDVVAAMARVAARPARKRREAALTPEAERRIEAESARIADPELRDLMATLRKRLGV